MRVSWILVVFLLVTAGEAVLNSRSAHSEVRFTAHESFKTARFIDTCAGYDTFLRLHPDSAFADQARALKSRKCRQRTSSIAPQPVVRRPAARPAPVRPSRVARRPRPRERSKPAIRRPKQLRLGGLCVDGNMDHCRRACRRGFRRACWLLRNTPKRLRYSGGTCREGNMDVCRRACRRWGRPAACARLRR